MQAQLSRLDQVWPPPTREEVEAVRLPPTREEIEAVLFEDLRWVELLILRHSMSWFCRCELVGENERADCLRGLWMFQLPRQPRARARRRQRRGGRSCERGPPGDDGGGGGDPDGPGPRSPHNSAGVS